VLRHLNLRVSDVLKEAQALDIEAFPNVAHVLLREVVDLVASDAIQKLGIVREASDIRGRVRVCLDRIDPKRDDDRLIDVWAEVVASGNTPITSPTMHDEIVGTNRLPKSEGELKRLSATYSHLLMRLDQTVGGSR